MYVLALLMLEMLLSCTEESLYVANTWEVAEYFGGTRNV